MDDGDVFEVVSVGSVETVEPVVTTCGTEEPNNAPEVDISAPTSRREYSNAISGFLILNWRSPLTPSHVSFQIIPHHPQT